MAGRIGSQPRNADQASETTGRISSAKERLREKLRGLDVASLGLSEYNQRYLGQKLKKIDDPLELYEHLLTLCLSGHPSAIEDVAIVDYGAGSGVLSLFAKEVGIGTVVYNDIYDVSGDDARRVSEAVGLPLDHFVCGDVDELVAYVAQNNVPINAIVSYDVLEHIYDVESHFEALGSMPLPSGFLRIVHGSGANIRNPRYVRRVTKAQHADENFDREPEWGWKERDSLQSFLEIRKTIVADAGPELTPDQVDSLARATRGLRKDDIESSVAEYRETGRISYQPDHPTNTCDPWTGNWSEHLMSHAWLEQVLRDTGFRGKILAGRYPIAGTGPKKVVKQVLNAGLSAFGRAALPIAPYYVVYAEKSADPATADTARVEQPARS